MDLSSKHVHSSRTRLKKERDDFFDTQVSGDAEVWGALRLVTSLLREGELLEAQGIFDAAGATCPTGKVEDGVYDERGKLYEIPQWVVSDPKQWVEEYGETGDEEGETLDGSGEVQEEKKEMREEKGKGRAIEDVQHSADGSDVGTRTETMKVKARLSNTGADVVLRVRKTMKVALLIQTILTEAAIAPGTKIKLAYLGRILETGKPLGEQGWVEGHVINVLVFG